jgi:hypothetical protein
MDSQQRNQSFPEHEAPEWCPSPRAIRGMSFKRLCPDPTSRSIKPSVYLTFFITVGRGRTREDELKTQRLIAGG